MSHLGAAQPNRPANVLDLRSSGTPSVAPLLLGFRHGSWPSRKSGAHASLAAALPARCAEAQHSV